MMASSWKAGLCPGIPCRVVSALMGPTQGVDVGAQQRLLL